MKPCKSFDDVCQDKSYDRNEQHHDHPINKCIMDGDSQNGVREKIAVILKPYKRGLRQF